MNSEVMNDLTMIMAALDAFEVTFIFSLYPFLE